MKDTVVPQLHSPGATKVPGAQPQDNILAADEMVEQRPYTWAEASPTTLEGLLKIAGVNPLEALKEDRELALDTVVLYPIPEDGGIRTPAELNAPKPIRHTEHLLEGPDHGLTASTSRVQEGLVDIEEQGAGRAFRAQAPSSPQSCRTLSRRRCRPQGCRGG